MHCFQMRSINYISRRNKQQATLIINTSRLRHRFTSLVGAILQTFQIINTDSLCIGLAFAEAL